MSIPIVFAGNIVLNLNDSYFSQEYFIGLATAFIFGLATIHILLKIAQKINFGYFVLTFGILTLVSTIF